MKKTIFTLCLMSFSLAFLFVGGFSADAESAKEIYAKQERLLSIKQTANTLLYLSQENSSVRSSLEQIIITIERIELQIQKRIEEVGFVCESTLTYDGQDYETVQIGDQCWMAENLNYDNGCTTGTWRDGTYTSCAYNTTATGDEYGLLYQWQAAMDACPDGWHLPSDDEWKILEGQLGMIASDLDVIGWRYSGNVGAKLKGGDGGSEEWDLSCVNSLTWYNETKQSHLCYQTAFNALPGRNINTAGTSNAVGPFTYFWSSSVDTSTTAWSRSLYHSDSGVYRYAYGRAYGFSVRCLRD